MGRKSTAQPRPVLTVPPRGIGPIVEPNENDVLCGRGGRINSHPGNVQFRDVINAKKKEYLAPTTKKLEKAHIAAAIVSDIRCMDPPGRFLKEDRDTGLWFDIGDAKAIKKTGQALREDAPDIRHELEGDDSSGDEKTGESDNDKKADSSKGESEKKSPKASAKPKISPPSSLKQPQTCSSVAARSPQKIAGETAVWPQGNVPITQQDYQAQIVMPPPYSNQMSNIYSSPYQAHMQGFETRNIPIQAPLMRQNVYSLPNQLYSGARSVTGKVASVSKQAMEALHPSRHHESPYDGPPDDIAFGRTFHPPETPTVLSSDNTMSTISGLSEPLSSNIGGSGLGLSGGRGSGLMGLDSMSVKSSNLSGQNSLRLSNLGLRGQSRQFDAMAMSGYHGSMRSATGSLTRSFSFPDMSSLVEGDSWRAIMEADDEVLDETAAKSILSGGSSGLGYGSSRVGPRNSSAMSISGLSMDLASNASSTQWLAAAGLSNPPLPDDRTFASGMSTDLYALDLAAHDQFRM